MHKVGCSYPLSRPKVCGNFSRCSAHDLPLTLPLARSRHVRRGPTPARLEHAQSLLRWLRPQDAFDKRWRTYIESPRGKIDGTNSIQFKRTCPPKDLADKLSEAEDAPERPPCATRTGVSNLCFPRTDPTVIMAVVSHDGQRIMLGRQRRWPPHWYSTLAGFLEPAESVEEAVRREVWEESGIHLGRVVIHSTQPWPYPANLMIGAIGQAIPEGEKVHLGHDAELEDAKWFSFDEVREALRTGTSGLGEDPGPDYKAGGLRLPPSTAIANQLMTAVVNGFASGEPKI